MKNTKTFLSNLLSHLALEELAQDLTREIRSQVNPGLHHGRFVSVDFHTTLRREGGDASRAVSASSVPRLSAVSFASV